MLTARSPLAAERLGDPRFEHAADADLPFELFAHSATFGGATLDHGSRLLLRTLREQPPAAPARIADIGCGNGVLAVSAALAWPDAEVIASDQSEAAVLAIASPQQLPRGSRIASPCIAPTPPRQSPTAGPTSCC